MKQDRLLCAAALRLNIPPSYDKYMEWGFFDGSVRFYSADSRKVVKGSDCFLKLPLLTGFSYWATSSTSISANSPARSLRTPGHW